MISKMQTLNFPTGVIKASLTFNLAIVNSVTLLGHNDKFQLDNKKPSQIASRKKIRGENCESDHRL